MKAFSKYILLLTAITFFSCHREDFPANYQEPIKSLKGTWKIVDAVRNGTDLTTRFDFSHFKLTFSDSSYTIDSLVPFVVSQNGTYHLDNAQYPFKIYFQASGNSPEELGFNYPVANGVRNIVLTFSPGCTSNSYTYTFQKVN